MSRGAMRYGDDWDRPRRRSRNDAGSTAVTLLIVGGVLGAFALVVGFGVLLLFYLTPRNAGAPQQNQALAGGANPAIDDSPLFRPAFDPPRDDPPPRENPPPRDLLPRERPKPNRPKDAQALAADLTGDHFTAKAAMEALTDMGSKAEPEVIPYLDHRDFSVRHRSAQVIEKIGTTKSLPELRRVVQAGRSVGGTCEKALASIRSRERQAGRIPAAKKPPPASEEAIRTAASLPGGHFQAAAAMEKLKAMGPAAEAAVIPYLDHDNFNARHRAAQVLERIGTSASLDELQRVVDARRSVLGACEKAIAAIEEREEAKN